jgi:hypothetical protein
LKFVEVLRGVEVRGRERIKKGRRMVEEMNKCCRTRKRERAKGVRINIRK